MYCYKKAYNCLKSSLLEKLPSVADHYECYMDFKAQELEALVAFTNVPFGMNDDFVRYFPIIYIITFVTFTYVHVTLTKQHFIKVTKAC